MVQSQEEIYCFEQGIQ